MRQRGRKHGTWTTAAALAAGLCAAVFRGCVSAPPPDRTADQDLDGIQEKAQDRAKAPKAPPTSPAPALTVSGGGDLADGLDQVTAGAFDGPPGEVRLRNLDADAAVDPRSMAAGEAWATERVLSITPLQSATQASVDWEGVLKARNRPESPAEHEPASDPTKDKKVVPPKPTGEWAGPPTAAPAVPGSSGRDGPAGGGGAGAEQKQEGGDRRSAAAPAADRGGAGRPPAGRSVGRPADGVTREERRDQLDLPRRVGKDDAAVAEAQRMGVDAELARDPQPRFDEELWVIQRPARASRELRGPEAPRSGALMLREAPRGAERAAVLRETTARAAITGPVSRVTLAQRFENPSRAAMDAVYVLPLPRDAAITDFVMTVGTRKIRGVIRERAEAEKIFLDAQRAGKVVSLLGEDAPNLFVQKIGNLASGASLDVSITYFSTMEYSAGAYEFVLPLTATPQYQGAAAISPEVRDGHGVSVEVQVDAGVPIRGLACPTHEVDATALSASEARIVLRPADTLPNRDLVLRILVASREGPTVGLLPQPDQSGTYFSVVIVPPLRDASGAGRGPIELVLVPDFASAATPEQAAQMQRAAARLLSRLTERDRVLVVADPASAGVPTAAGPDAVAAAVRGVGGGVGGGGAPLAGLLRAALELPAPAGDRVVCILSRGEPADGVDMLRDARTRLGPARLFAVSIDGPPSLTLESLARIGRGGVITLGQGAPGIDGPLDSFMDEVSRPVLSELTIDWGGAQVADVFPRRLPDLCAGRPVHVVGRMISPPRDGAPIRVIGVSHGPSGVRREELALPWRDASGVPGAVHTLWARAKVLAMSEALGRGAEADAELRQRIVATALAHNLVSPFTSFVSVDAMSDAPAGAPLQANRDAAAPIR